MPFKRSSSKKASHDTAQTEESLPDYVCEVETESLRLLDAAHHNEIEMEAYYPTMLEPTHSDADTLRRVESLKRASANMTRALAQTVAVEDELTARRHDIRKQNKKRRLIPAAPANAAIDEREQASRHFARGLNCYKILLICFIGSFLGVAIELIWCLINNGYLESRAGLVYGPFNLLYGVGAVALSICLYQFRNHGSWLSFLGGMLAGSAVEYACSWAQELIFGSRSWDYSAMPFNINGRICLLYSVFWGLLGVLWMKTLYPFVAKWILKIPNRIGKIGTWALTIFFAFNIVMSAAAMYRWSQRIQGVEPTNSVESFLDSHFPDSRMERIYANMTFAQAEHEEADS